MTAATTPSTTRATEYGQLRSDGVVAATPFVARSLGFGDSNHPERHGTLGKLAHRPAKNAFHPKCAKR